MINLLLRFAQATTEIDSVTYDTGLPKATADGSNIALIIQWVFAVIGVIAVVVIMYAGFRLMIARGDNPDAVKRARNTVITAAVGLFIALSAELIVAFVINKI